MNKADVIDVIAEEADISKAAATAALSAFLDCVVSTLKKGDSLSLVGFGAFAVKNRAARVGRNPQTGEPIEIKAANVPGFKAGKAFKDAVNSGTVVEEA